MVTNVLDTLKAVADHVRANPDTVVSLARHALHQRIAVPMDVIRWALEQLPPGKGKPERLDLRAEPPALRVDATIDLMGNALETSSAIYVEEVRLEAGSMRLLLRLADVKAHTPNEKSPIAQLLKSGALDLSKPANLLNMVPKKPPVIASAKDDKIEIDLMKVPRFAGNGLMQKALATIAPVLKVTEIRTEDDMLLIGLRPMPSGLRDAISAVRG